MLQVKNTRSENELDPWHYAGYASPLFDIENIIDDIKEKLPYVDFNSLPLYIGNTGYITQNRNSLIQENKNVKSKDHVGRDIFIINKYLYFRRYQMGSTFVYGKINDTCVFADLVYHDDWSTILNSI